MVRRVARPLVCIPTYNEASNILDLVEQVHEAAPEADVLVIDDASPDGTGELGRTQILKDARLEIMSRAANATAADARLHGRLPLLQYPRAAVSRHAPAPLVWILRAGGAPDPLRARRAHHRRAAHHVHRPHAWRVQDFAPGDFPGDGNRDPASGETELTRRRAIQAAILLAVGLLILFGLLRSVHPGEVGAAIGHASPGWIALAEVAYLGF